MQRSASMVEFFGSGKDGSLLSVNGRPISLPGGGAQVGGCAEITEPG